MKRTLLHLPFYLIGLVAFFLLLPFFSGLITEHELKQLPDTISRYQRHWFESEITFHNGTQTEVFHGPIIWESLRHRPLIALASLHSALNNQGMTLKESGILYLNGKLQSYSQIEIPHLYLSIKNGSPLTLIANEILTSKQFSLTHNAWRGHETVKIDNATVQTNHKPFEIKALDFTLDGIGNNELARITVHKLHLLTAYGLFTAQAHFFVDHKQIRNFTITTHVPKKLARYILINYYNGKNTVDADKLLAQLVRVHFIQADTKQKNYYQFSLQLKDNKVYSNDNFVMALGRTT